MLMHFILACYSMFQGIKGMVVYTTCNMMFAMFVMFFLIWVGHSEFSRSRKCLRDSLHFYLSVITLDVVQNYRQFHERTKRMLF